jgi:hypothetical protein
MPEFVKIGLVDRGLLEAYQNRPPYQQNDYVGWINRAQRMETKLKRLDQHGETTRFGDSAWIYYHLGEFGNGFP